MSSITVLILTARDARRTLRSVARAAQLSPEFASIIKRVGVKGGAKQFAFRSARAAIGGTALGILFQADVVFDFLVGRSRSSGGRFGKLKTTGEVRGDFRQFLSRSLLVNPITGTQLFLRDPKQFIINAVERRVEFLQDVGLRGVPAVLVGGLELSATEFVSLTLPKEVAVPVNKVLDFIL